MRPSVDALEFHTSNAASLSRRTASNPLHSAVLAIPRFNSFGAYWPSYVSPVPNHRRTATQRLDTVSWSTLPLLKLAPKHSTADHASPSGGSNFNSYHFECLFLSRTLRAGLLFYSWRHIPLITICQKTVAKAGLVLLPL